MINEFHNTAVIDADFIIWIACNGNKVYEHGVALRKDGKFIYTDKTVEEAKATCDLYMNDILHLVKADSYYLCLTSGVTFRYNLDHSYKANRIGMPKPLWFNEVKQHMIDQWGAFWFDGLEADDIVNIIKNSLDSSFIIAADKDILECIPGRHFDARKGRVQFLEICKEQADLNFAISVLTGDSVDGIPNLIKGMGPKNAAAGIAIRKELQFVPPLVAAFQMFTYHLGEREGIIRFANQYSLLKILETEEQAKTVCPGFFIPEPQCFNCVEHVISKNFYDLWEMM